nr:NosD domain-containing protein [Methanohalophilus levihalophilus]
MIEVDSSGSKDHTTIQAAINAANASDIIIVHPGTYIENVIVNKELTLSSFSGNPDDTVVSASDANEPVFNITADNVSIRGFDVTSASGLDNSGVLLNNVTNTTIVSNKVTGNSIGIHLNQSGNNTIYNNYFNNTNNVLLSDTNVSNIWNTTKSGGPNIIEGPYVGGNYWAKPDGSGFSQTCNDADKDGFCDLDFVIGLNNTDHLSLNIDPSIDIELLMNGKDADTPLGPYVRYYYRLYWNYSVTNSGNINLTNITVNDESIGFIGTIPVLEPGSSIGFSSSEQAKYGHNENHAITVGTSPQGVDVSDTDPGHYFGYAPPETYDIPTAPPLLTAGILGIAMVLFLRRELK